MLKRSVATRREKAQSCSNAAIKAMSKTIAQIIEEHPWMEAFKDDIKPRCTNCGVDLGDKHKDGCDTARCSVCQGQRLSCGCKNSEPDVWTGIMYPSLHRIAVENDLWCRSYVVRNGVKTLLDDEPNIAEVITDRKCKILWHQECRRDDKYAKANLNMASLLLSRSRTI